MNFPKKFVITIICSFSIVVLSIVGIYYLNSKSQEKNSKIDFEKKGDEFFSTFQYSKAVEQYKLGINATPSNENLYIKISDIYLLKSQEDEALNVLNLAIGKVISEYKIQNKLGKIYLSLYQFDKAQECFEKAYTQNKEDIENAIDLIKIWNLSSDNLLKSIEIMQNIKCSNKECENQKYYYLSILNLQDKEKARQFFEKIQSNSKDSKIELLKKYFNEVLQNESETFKETYKAFILLNNKLYFQSLSVLDNIISKNDEYFMPFFYKGIIYFETKNLEKAKENLLNAIEIDSTKIDVYILLADIYKLQNNTDATINTYEQALKIQESTEILSKYADTLISFELYKNAEDVLKKLINFDNQTKLESIYKLSNLYALKLNKHDEALKNLLDVENSVNFSSLDKNLKCKIYSLIGFLYLKKDDNENALKYLNKAKEIQNNLPDTFYYFGLFYKKVNKIEDALLNFEKAIDIDTIGEISPIAEKEIALLKE